MTGALDAALERVADQGAEFGRGLSNHAPMAAHALCAMGLGDEASTWVDGYKSRLDQPREVERDRITAITWKDALGDAARVGDWTAYFERELEGRSDVDLLADWLPRLIPGAMAAAAHGLIRTAHAVRMLEEQRTDLRVRELAAGLGYWAARFQPLPGDPRPHGALTAYDALRSLPTLATSERGAFLIFEQVRKLDSVVEFPSAVNAFAAPTAPQEALDAVITAAARTYVTCERGTEIAFIHTVTGPTALRALLPYVDEAQQRAAVAYGWQVVAAITAAYGPAKTVAPSDVAPDDGDVTDWSDLADRALATGDEHAIKMVEACWREHERAADRVYIAAARRAVGLPIAWAP